MTIKLYKSTAEKNRVDKTAYLTAVATLTGVLRAESSIVNPSIMIESTGIPAANYMYISDFGRYYFITDIVAISYKLIQINARVDVLMSYKGVKDGLNSTGIYALESYITRQENTFNDSVSDAVYPVEIPAYVTHTVGTVNSGSLWYGSEHLLRDGIVNTNFRYIMQYHGTLNKNTSNLSNTYPLMTVIMPLTAAKEVITEIRESTTLSSSNKTVVDYIYDFYALPSQPNSFSQVQRTSAGDTVTFNFPGWGHNITVSLDVTEPYPIFGYDNTSTFIPKNTYFKMTFATPSRSTRYLNYNPYAQYFVKFAPFGKIELDPSIIYPPTGTIPNNTTFYFRVETDSLTGSSNLYYGRTTSTCDNFLGSANVKIRIPLSAESFNAFNIASGALQLATGIAGAVSGAPLALVPGALSLAQACTTPNTSITGGDNRLIDNVPELIIHQHYQTETVPNLIGRPACYDTFLYTLSGFTKVGAVHVENLPGSPTDEEISDVETLLGNGIIL